jgi:hypothetical protein
MPAASKAGFCAAVLARTALLNCPVERVLVSVVKAIGLEGPRKPNRAPSFLHPEQRTASSERLADLSKRLYHDFHVQRPSLGG